MRELLEDLREYDGRAMTLLGEVQVRFAAAPGYLMSLADLSSCPEAHVSDGATWLLKAHLENGGTLAPLETNRLLESLPTVTDWAAQLHVCQMLQWLNVGKDQAAPVAAWLEPLTKHERPFLRAWSMSALQALAQQHPSHSENAEAALCRAEGDKAASVKARARQVRTGVKRGA